jgi:hypothetical protein
MYLSKKTAFVILLILNFNIRNYQLFYYKNNCIYFHEIMYFIKYYFKKASFKMLTDYLFTLYYFKKQFYYHDYFVKYFFR